MMDPVFEAFDRIVEAPELDWDRLIDETFPANDKYSLELKRMLEAWRARPDFRISTIEISRAIESISSPQMSTLEPPVIDGIEILNELGVGGSGVVYYARQHDPVERDVAVKVFFPRPGGASHMRREAMSLAKLNHPNIATLHDAGLTASGQFYAVLEFIRGDHLTQYIRTHTVSIQDVLGIFRQICEAVAHANEAGVIHRDIKPANILVADAVGGPVVKVLDFSIARSVAPDQQVTQTLDELVQGTPEYMSPEQANPELGECTTRSDVFSLGVVLYELLAGEHPYVSSGRDRPSFFQILNAIQRDEPVSPSSMRSHNQRHGPWKPETWSSQVLRGDLDAIVMKALRIDPDDRYATARELSEDLGRYQNHEPIIARRLSAYQRMAKATRRHPLITVMALALSIIAIAIASMSYAGYRRELQVNAREAMLHAGTRLALASASMTGGDLSRAQQQLQAIPAKYRTPQWRVLNAACDQSRSALQVDPQGIAAIWTSRDMAYVAGRSGNVWSVQLHAEKPNAIIIAKRSGAVRKLAATANGDRLFLLCDMTIEVWSNGELESTLDYGENVGPDWNLTDVTADGCNLEDSMGLRGRIRQGPEGWFNETEVPDPGLKTAISDGGSQPVFNFNASSEGVIEVLATDSERLITSLVGHARQPIFAEPPMIEPNQSLVTGDAMGYIRIWDLPIETTKVSQGWTPIHTYANGWILSDGSNLGYGPETINIGQHELESVWPAKGAGDSMLLKASDGYKAVWITPRSEVEYKVIQLDRMPTFSPSIDLDTSALWIIDRGKILRRYELELGSFQEISCELTPIMATLPTERGLLAIESDRLALYPDNNGDAEILCIVPVGSQFLDASGDVVVACNHTGLGIVYNSSTKQATNCSFGKAVHAIEIIEEFGLLAVGQGDGRLVVHDLTSGEELVSVPIFDGPVRSIRYGQDGNLRLLSAAGEIHWIDLTKGD